MNYALNKTEFEKSCSLANLKSLGKTAVFKKNPTKSLSPIQNTLLTEENKNSFFDPYGASNKSLI